MTATKEDITRWLKDGQEQGATHVIIVHDPWDHGNFPLFVMPGQNAREVFQDKYVKPLGPNEMAYRTDECFDLRMDIEAQRKERRANHWD